MARGSSKQSRWADLDPKIRLEMFVLRARRISEHPLLREHRDLMQSLYEGERKLIVRVDRNTREVIGTEETIVSPPEELMDSLAARVRPLLLDSEPVHFPDVLNAMGALVPNEIIAAAYEGHDLQWWLSKWKDMSSKDGPAQAWHVEVSDTIQITDRMLANRWLYADLIHADPLQPEYNEISFEDRFRAGCEVISRTCSVIERFFGLVQFLQGEGVLALSDEAFQARVVLSSVERKTDVVARIAPEGASLDGDKSAWPVVNPAEWIDRKPPSVSVEAPTSAVEHT